MLALREREQKREQHLVGRAPPYGKSEHPVTYYIGLDTSRRFTEAASAPTLLDALTMMPASSVLVTANAVAVPDNKRARLLQ